MASRLIGRALAGAAIAMMSALAVASPALAAPTNASRAIVSTAIVSTATDEETPTPTPTIAPTPDPETVTAAELGVACDTAGDLADAELYDQALGVVQAAIDAGVAAITAGRPLGDAVTACETQRKAIVEQQAADAPAPSPTPVPEPDAKALGNAWAAFVAGSLAPLVTPGLFILGAWILLFVITRLAAQVWGAGSTSTPIRRRGAGIIGAVSGLLAPIVAVYFVLRTGPVLTADPASSADPAVQPAVATTPVPTPTGTAWLGRPAPEWSPTEMVAANGSLVAGGVALVVWGVIGIVFLSYAFATRQKITVTFTAAANSRDFVPEFTGILHEMGGSPARGVEVPVGPDLSSLDASILDLTKVGPAVSFISSVWTAIRSISPWKLEVKIEGDDAAEGGVTAASFTLTRNGRLVASDRITADSQEYLLDQAAGATPAQRLSTVIAAHLIASLRQVYATEWAMALHGATAPSGIAMQFLATKWHNGWTRRPTGIALLANSLNRDAANRSALVALWNFMYRESESPDDWALYNTWLIDQVNIEIGIAAGGQPPQLVVIAKDDLLLRLLLTQGALARNLSANGTPSTDDDLQRADLALDILSVPGKGPVDSAHIRRLTLAEINFAQLSAEE